ncbi:MAG: acid phosphatase, partial [Solirubrobacterales bacterium]|nr:acid phosphatase [Solirubrobacterales bacterium]
IDSPCIKPGTETQLSYNHFSALRWMEDNWGLTHLGAAGTEGLRPFGTDVFTDPECTTGLTGTGGGGGGAGGAAGSSGPPTHLKITPRKVKAGTLQMFHLSLTSGTVSCREAAIIHFAGHKTHTSRKGKARITARLPHPGKFTAVARPTACKLSKATVHAR